MTVTATPETAAKVAHAEKVDRVIEKFFNRPTISSRSCEEARENFKDLTPRECEVLDLFVYGCKPRKIAEGLGISPKTCDIHLANIKRKFRTKVNADLVRWYFMVKLADVEIGQKAPKD